jgi:hypothetical protein
MSQTADLTTYSPPRSPGQQRTAGGKTDGHVGHRAYNSLPSPVCSGREPVAVDHHSPLPGTAERVEIMDRAAATPLSSRAERAGQLKPGRRWRWRFLRGGSSCQQTDSSSSCSTAVMRGSLSYQLDQLSTSCQVKRERRKRDRSNPKDR